MIQEIPNVYLDESGNTGPDLGNHHQPVYAVASILDDGSWDNHRAQAHEDELKFSALVTTDEGRDRILAIIGNATPDRVKSALADKLYMGLAKIVDELIEPMAQADNFDLYGTGSHRGMTDMTYVALRWLAGEDGLVRVVTDFVQMMRTRDKSSVEEFFSTLDEIGRRSGEAYDQLSFVALTREWALQEVVGAPRTYFELDPCVPLVSSLAQAWTSELQVPHRFIHDTSGKLEQWREHFSYFGRMDVTPRTFRMGEVEITVPVMTFDVQFETSHDSPLIQIADVIGGATRYLAQHILRSESTPFSDVLRGTVLPELVVEALWFTPPGEPEPSST